jgi:hypothetical protein
MDSLSLILPEGLEQKYDCYEWRHGKTILEFAHPNEWRDIVDVLTNFVLEKEDILKPGGRKSDIATKLDSAFTKLGWKEKKFDTRIQVDNLEYHTPTHAVDCFKNKVALEIEWNNKDPFFDRDLNNFRLLFELRAIDVGVIITRCSDLQFIFDELGKGTSYGSSTTHMNKLLPRIDGGGGGGCPLVVFGIRKEAYRG